MILADGFEETQTVILLSLLREAGLCVKSVGLKGGLITSLHGISIKPDLTLTDLQTLRTTIQVSLVILPEGEQSLAKLKGDPRIHKLLYQTAHQQGQIVTSSAGLPVLQATRLSLDEENTTDNRFLHALILRDIKVPLETFAQNLINQQKRKIGDQR
jgi:4-methyl-5(b-hydroxyethyl)-thiazole monophosphate biosynthesis